MKLKLIVAVFMILAAVACVKRTDTGPSGMPPLKPPRLNKKLVARINQAEAEFWDIFAIYGRFMNDYDYHLVDAETHPEKTEKEFFMAFCMEDEFEMIPPTDLSPYGRIEFIDIWCYGLSECCEEFRSQFLSHLEFFHPDVELDIELKERDEILREPVEARVAAVEKNIQISRYNVGILGEVYDAHIANDH